MFHVELVTVGDIFGPGIAHLPALGFRSGRCLGVHICGTPVQVILDQKKLTGLAGGVREGQNIAQNGPRFYIFLASEPSRSL